MINAPAWSSPNFAKAGSKSLSVLAFRTWLIRRCRIKAAFNTSSDNGIGLAVGLVFGGNGLFPASSTKVLEAKCRVNDLLNEEKRCNTFIGAGATFAITVNTTTQQVLFEVTKTDRNWLKGAYFLDNCKIVDAGNWECTRTDAELTQRKGMLNGQFYRWDSVGPGPNHNFY